MHERSWRSVWIDYRNEKYYLTLGTWGLCIVHLYFYPQHLNYVLLFNVLWSIFTQNRARAWHWSTRRRDLRPLCVYVLQCVPLSWWTVSCQFSVSCNRSHRLQFVNNKVIYSCAEIRAPTVGFYTDSPEYHTVTVWHCNVQTPTPH